MNSATSPLLDVTTKVSQTVHVSAVKQYVYVPELVTYAEVDGITGVSSKIPEIEELADPM